jgi:vacuolar-type H+-ATPase subunit I/STV1
VITLLQKRKGLHLRAMFVMVFIVASLGTAHAADDKKSKAQQDRIAKLQQAQQVLEQEKTQLQADKADAEKVTKTARGELERIRTQGRKDASQVSMLQADLAALTGKLALSERTLSTEREKLQALQLAYSQLQDRSITSLRNVEQQLTARNASLNTCETSNTGLYKLNTDLLSLYEKAAAPPGLLRMGNLTQLSRVKVENEVTACLDKLDDLKVAPTKTQ